MSRWCLGLFASAVFCIGWACALWFQRLFYVDSKGDVKQFFWLAVWAVFGACPDGV